jgi:hypothetical protein
MSYQDEVVVSLPKKGGRNKDRKTEQAIAAVMRCRTIKEAAADCGLSYGALKMWLKQDWFRAEYDEAKRQMLDSTINQLRTAGGDAVSLLHKVVKNPKLATTPRVTAARAIVELLLKCVETQDIVARLERIEKAQQEVRL